MTSRVLDALFSSLDFTAKMRDICLGLFQTAVLTRHCGLASTVTTAATCEDDSPITGTGRLLEQTTRQLAEMAYSGNTLEASLGMAAINSLIDVDQGICSEVNARDILLERGRGKKMAMVGRFPFAGKLKTVVSDLWVLEQNPREGDFAAGEAGNLLPQAEVVAITGTTFINHTIDQLLSLCRRDAYVMIMGPTTPLAPALFRCGISALAGTLVVDIATVLRGVSQGAGFRQLTGIKLLTIEKD